MSDQLVPIEEDYDMVDIPTSSELNNSGQTKFQKVKRDVGIVTGAAVAGGVAGLVAAGPIVAVVGAVGVGALATQNTRGGDVAKSAGSVVVAANSRAKQLDEKHNILQKVRRATTNLVQTTRRINERHHVIENLLKGVKNTFQFVAGKLQPKHKMITNK